MTSTIRDVVDLLHAEERRVRDAVTDCMNFDSEGRVKARKLAHLEGELAGFDQAIRIVEEVGRVEPVAVR